MRSSSEKKQNEYAKLSLTLFGITFIVALLLAMVNYFTAPKIALINRQKLEQAMANVMPDAESFEDKTQTVLAAWDSDTPVLSVQAAKDKNGQTIGYCVETSPKGYSDVIDMMVGLNSKGEITDTSIISISDTPGIGMQVKTDKNFSKQFIGKEGTALSGIKNGTPSSSEALLISGATYSSGGFLNGINAALQVFRILNGEVA